MTNEEMERECRSMSKDNAFPDETQAGLTKREYFAAMALQGLASRGFEVDVTVRSSILLADELIKELYKSEANQLKK
jgi:hypothetical protein